jgi:hypothetical protein
VAGAGEWAHGRHKGCYRRGEDEAAVGTVNHLEEEEACGTEINTVRRERRGNSDFRGRGEMTSQWNIPSQGHSHPTCPSTKHCDKVGYPTSSMSRPKAKHNLKVLEKIFVKTDSKLSPYFFPNIRLAK